MFDCPTASPQPLSEWPSRPAYNRSRDAHGLIVDLEAAPAEVTRLYERWQELTAPTSALCPLASVFCLLSSAFRPQPSTLNPQQFGVTQPSVGPPGDKGAAVLRWENAGEWPSTLKAVASARRTPLSRPPETEKVLPSSFSSILHHLRLAKTALHRPRDRPELLESSASRLAPGGSLSLFACAQPVAQDGMAAGSANAPSGAPVELGPRQPGTQCCCSCWTSCCCCGSLTGSSCRCCS
jgi:hypothetical protein